MKPLTALLRLSNFDSPPVGTPDATAFEMRVLRLVQVEGMEEVLLCELLQPVTLEDGRGVTHAAVSPHLAGQTLTDAPFGGRAANLAFVTADAPGDRTRLTGDDVLLAGLGMAQAIPRKLGWIETIVRRARGLSVPE